MKKLLSFVLAGFVLSFAACSDDDGGGGDTPAGPTLYMNIKPNSTWQYRATDSSSSGTNISNFTLTSTSADTIINGRSYHVYDHSTNGRVYNAIVSNNTYYTYQPLPLNISTDYYENLYLKSEAAINDSWVQNYNIPIDFNGQQLSLAVAQTNRIAEKGITKTVNGVTYNNVIHVSSTLGMPPIPGYNLQSDLHFYYAPNAGLIHSNTFVVLNQPGNSTTVRNIVDLMSSDLK